MEENGMNKKLRAALAFMAVITVFALAACSAGGNGVPQGQRIKHRERVHYEVSYYPPTWVWYYYLLMYNNSYMMVPAATYGYASPGSYYNEDDATVEDSEGDGVYNADDPEEYSSDDGDGTSDDGSKYDSDDGDGDGEDGGYSDDGGDDDSDDGGDSFSDSGDDGGDDDGLGAPMLVFVTK
jgi:hypothetical protein